MRPRECDNRTGGETMPKTHFAAKLEPLKSNWTVRYDDGNPNDPDVKKTCIELRRFRIRCGAPVGCHGILGYITENPPGRLALTRDTALDRGKPGYHRAERWIATHPKGY